MFLLFFYAVCDVLGAHWSVALVRQTCVDRNYSFHFRCIRSLKNFISSYSLCWTTSFLGNSFHIFGIRFIYSIFIGLGGFEKMYFFFFRRFLYIYMRFWFWYFGWIRYSYIETIQYFLTHRNKYNTKFGALEFSKPIICIRLWNGTDCDNYKFNWNQRNLNYWANWKFEFISPQAQSTIESCDFIWMKPMHLLILLYVFWGGFVDIRYYVHSEMRIHPNLRKWIFRPKIDSLQNQNAHGLAIIWAAWTGRVNSLND